MNTDTLVWVTPDGAAFPLTGQPDVDVHWALGVQGRFMPPVSIVEDTVPQQIGTRLRAIQVGPRDVELPLTVFGADEVALRTRIRQLVRQFDPTRGDGYLQSTAADGTMRRLKCRYTEGLAGTESRDDTGRTWQRFVLVLHAADPLWEDTAPNDTTYTTASIGSFLSTSFLPVKLTGDALLGDQTVTNDGDLDAYPVFTVRGPATSFTLENVTTGQRITYEAALADGQVLTIDTRPYVRSVRTADGVNRYASLSLDSVLWHLPPGPSSIRLTLTGSTEASFVTISYRRLWLAP